MKRLSWEEYGISKSRYIELKDYCSDKNNISVVEDEANKAADFLAPYIVESVQNRKTYEQVYYLGNARIPCGRTDFYAYRRYFYHLINVRLQNGTNK